MTMTSAPVRRISHDPSAVQRIMLPNGLRVWIEPRPESESVTALLVVRVGSRHETRANNGISHFVEHMVFDGTEKWPTEEAVADAITHRGGHWNGWTDEETTTYFVQLAQQANQTFGEYRIGCSRSLRIIWFWREKNKTR